VRLWLPRHPLPSAAVAPKAHATVLRPQSCPLHCSLRVNDRQPPCLYFMQCWLAVLALLACSCWHCSRTSCSAGLQCWHCPRSLPCLTPHQWAQTSSPRARPPPPLWQTASWPRPAPGEVSGKSRRVGEVDAKEPAGHLLVPASISLCTHEVHHAVHHQHGCSRGSMALVLTGHQACARAPHRRTCCLTFLKSRIFRFLHMLMR